MRPVFTSWHLRSGPGGSYLNCFRFFVYYTTLKIHNKIDYIFIGCIKHRKKNPIYVFLFWELRGLSPNRHINVSVSDLYCIFPGSVHIFPCSRTGTPILEIYKSLTEYECRNWETEHYNSVLEITVSFLGIHKWEPDIYIGFSPVLHLQWTCLSYIICICLHFIQFLPKNNRFCK